MDTKHKEELLKSQRIEFTVEPLKDLTATGNITAGSITTESIQIGSGKEAKIQQVDNTNEGEIYFSDNGQIKSLDNNHRILFRRSEDKMELREKGQIIFSAGADQGQETGSMVIDKDHNVTIKGSSLQIGSTVLTEDNIKQLLDFLNGNSKVVITTNAVSNRVLDNYNGKVNTGDDNRSIQFQNSNVDIKNNSTTVGSLNNCWVMQIKFLKDT